MNKLMLSALVAASLASGAALAQGGSADEQAGSAWRSAPNYGPVPGSADYYGNSGFPPQPMQPYVYGNRVWVPYSNGTAYPYAPYARTRQDRDGDGVPNRRDRRPDDPSRY